MKKISFWDPYKDFQKTILPNGLTIYSTYWNRPWVHVEFVIHSGSLQDPKGKAGLAHFVEHLLSPGYKKDGKLIKKFGGKAWFGATSPTYTSLAFELPIVAKFLVKGFAIFDKMLTKIPDDRLLESERKIILREFHEKYPLQVIHEIKHRVFRETYAGTQFENFLGSLGVPETITAISIEDIQEFFRQHYVPSNISIVVAGGLNHEAVIGYLAKSKLANAESGKGRLSVKNLSSVTLPQSRETVYRVSEILNGLMVENSAFEAFAIMPGSFSFHTLKLFKEIWRDFLMNEMREKKNLVYDVSVEVGHIGGCYDIRATLIFDPAKLDFVRKGMSAGTLRKIKNRKLFREKKDALQMSFCTKDLNIGEFCEIVKEDLTNWNRIITVAEEIDMFKAVSFEEYCELVDYLDDPERWWNLIQVP